MGELTASVAHEVNQPIAAAVTNAKTCLRWLTRDQPDIEEARAAAMRIVNDGTRAAEIIKRIRLLFRRNFGAGARGCKRSYTRDGCSLRGEAMRYSILLTTDLEVDIPRVMADRVQLQQVLMNLMLNGIDAMKDADGARNSPSKSQRGENHQVLVSVDDTGAGLHCSSRTKSSTRFSPPSLMAPAWDCLSAGLSLSHTAAACGLQTTFLAGQVFVLPYPPAQRQRMNPSDAPTVFVVDDDPSVRASIQGY